MKKKIIVISIIILCMVMACIYLLTRPKTLGNMNQSYTEQTTSSSDISFEGEAGKRIKISFRSNIISGDLDIVLCDSEGNIVYELDRAKALETYYTFDNSDTYTLVAECSDFIGTYEVKVYNVD